MSNGSSPPVVVTGNAAELIRKMFDQCSASGVMAVRVYRSGCCTGLVQTLSVETEARSEDTVWVVAGVTFASDPFSVSFMRGSVLDVDGSRQGKSGLVLHNPNAVHRPSQAISLTAVFAASSQPDVCDIRD